MCGRFARYSLSRELERYFNTHLAAFEIQPNYNVAPTQFMSMRRPCFHALSFSTSSRLPAAAMASPR